MPDKMLITATTTTTPHLSVHSKDWSAACHSPTTTITACRPPPPPTSQGGRTDGSQRLLHQVVREGPLDYCSHSSVRRVSVIDIHCIMYRVVTLP